MSLLIAASVLALSPYIGADHPSTPVYNDGWNQRTESLINSKERVHGYFVNWQDVFFFKGDVNRFNAFLGEYAKIPGASRKLVLHKGKLEVRSPWDKEPRRIGANWRLDTNTLVYIDSKQPKEQTARLELWLAGIPRDKIKVPENVTVEVAQPAVLRS